MDTDNQKTQDNIKWYFSLFSGKIFYAEADEKLDGFQIPLKCNPSTEKNCDKCHGRFYIHYDLTNRHFVPCPKCLKKYSDLDSLRIKKNE